MTTEIQPALTLHAGTAIAAVLCALNGRTADLPVAALNELAAHNDRLANDPTSEIEATLRRQAILLEHVELAYLRKAAMVKRPDYAALYGNTAIKANSALLNVLGALRRMDEEKRKADAIENAG
jgi:hypothetical protein